MDSRREQARLLRIRPAPQKTRFESLQKNSPFHFISVAQIIFKPSKSSDNSEVRKLVLLAFGRDALRPSKLFELEGEDKSLFPSKLMAKPKSIS